MMLRFRLFLGAAASAPAAGDFGRGASTTGGSATGVSTTGISTGGVSLPAFRPAGGGSLPAAFPRPPAASPAAALRRPHGLPAAAAGGSARRRLGGHGAASAARTSARRPASAALGRLLYRALRSIARGQVAGRSIAWFGWSLTRFSQENCQGLRHSQQVQNELPKQIDAQEQQRQDKITTSTTIDPRNNSPREGQETLFISASTAMRKSAKRGC